MSEVAGTLTDALLQRVRDQQALGICPVVNDAGVAQNPSTIGGRTFARRLLSHAQMLINGFEEQVLSTYSLTTNPYQLVYPISGAIQVANQWTQNNPSDDCVRVVGVRDGNVDLNRISFRTLAHVDRKWFRAIGPTFTSWSMLGADQLVLYPALPIAYTVNVVYLQRTPFLTDDGVATVLDNDVLPQVLDIAQAVYHLKHLDLDLLEPILKRLQVRYQPQMPMKERA